MEKKQQNEVFEIDLLELFNNTLKHWKLVAICVLIGIAVGVVRCVIASPVYESTALLRIKPGKGGVNFNPMEAVMGESRMAEQQVATYTEILKSRSVIDPVLERMAADFPNLPPEGRPKYHDFIQGRMRTEAVGKTELLKVITTANTAEYAQKINNYMLEAFQNRLVNLGLTEQRAVSKFLRGRSKQAKVELTDAESSLRNFLAQNKFFSPEEHVGLLNERITRIDNLLAENEIAENIALSKLKAVDAQLAAAGVISVAANQTTEGIQKAITELEVERISYLDKYTNKHPRVQEIQKQIVELKKKLSAEINKVVHLKAPSQNQIHQSLIGSKLQSEAELAVTRNKRNILTKLTEQNDNEIKKLPTLSQEYVQLKRNCDLAGEIYTMLAQKYEESQIAEAMEVGDVQIIDYGSLPEKPSAPRKLRILFICALLGGLFAVGHITLQTIFNTTIKTDDDIIKYLDLPVLGSIPEEKSFTDAIKNRKRSLLETLSLRLFRFRAVREVRKWKK